MQGLRCRPGSGWQLWFRCYPYAITYRYLVLVAHAFRIRAHNGTTTGSSPPYSMYLSYFPYPHFQNTRTGCHHLVVLTLSTPIPHFTPMVQYLQYKYWQSQLSHLFKLHTLQTTKNCTQDSQLYQTKALTSPRKSASSRSKHSANPWPSAPDQPNVPSWPILSPLSCPGACSQACTAKSPLHIPEQWRNIARGSYG